MLKKGTMLKTESGRPVHIDGFISSGGQADAHGATSVNTRAKGVVKEFHARFANNDTVKRIRFLQSQNLSLACNALCPPEEVIVANGLVGYYTRFVEGETLERLLCAPNYSFTEGLQLAATITHAVNVLHRLHIADGDIHSENVLVRRTGSVLEACVIDLDNFNAPGLPAPPCVGHNLYMAPELRRAKGLSAIPTIESDLYSLCVLIHEIILLRHVSAGNDGTEADFHKAMASGKWLQDPAVADRPFANLGGYPVEVLNADMARLFRAGLSLDPGERPSSDVWERELSKALNSVHPCPSCGGPCVVDASKTACPTCKRRFPDVSVKILSSGRSFRIDLGAMVLGRTELGGSPKVSSRHAILRKIGPETWLESWGTNGTYRWNGTGWTRLPDLKAVSIHEKDRLRFADVEALVE